MKAKVSKEFIGRPDTEALARTVSVGEVIDGDLAEYAVGAKLANAVGNAPKQEAKPGVKPEIKAKK